MVGCVASGHLLREQKFPSHAVEVSFLESQNEPNKKKTELDTWVITSDVLPFFLKIFKTKLVCFYRSSRPNTNNMGVSMSRAWSPL